MKKIGIVTMVGYDNYGNLLQNYAVKKLLENMGYQAVTLNNQVKTDESAHFNKISIWNKCKPKYVRKFLKVKANQLLGCKNVSDYTFLSIIRHLKNRKVFQKCKDERLEKFKAFRKMYIPYESLPIYDEKFSEKDYVAFICGSDVVWHPTYHYNKENDFLCFAPKYKRIALAPSFGVSEIPTERKEAYKVWLDGIEYLSVREDAGATIIKDLVKRKAEVLPDPTLTIDVKHWRSISRMPDTPPKGSYILCYFLGDETSEYSSWIRECASLGEKEIVSVCDANFLQYYASDPGEFLWLIDHASAVFTDSFHGIVFSMLFHAPFVAFRRVEERLSIFSRIESLLHCMNMENREFGRVTVEQFDKMDFDCIDEKIADMREKEKSFLKNALDEIEKGVVCNE